MTRASTSSHAVGSRQTTDSPLWKQELVSEKKMHVFSSHKCDFLQTNVQLMWKIKCSFLHSPRCVRGKNWCPSTARHRVTGQQFLTPPLLGLRRNKLAWFGHIDRTWVCGKRPLFANPVTKRYNNNYYVLLDLDSNLTTNHNLRYTRVHPWWWLHKFNSQTW